MRIRSARVRDAGSLADLSVQLGYPVSAAEMASRLQQILSDEGQAVYIAEDETGCIAGWVHGYRRQLLVADLHAEIGGLIVNESHRRSGVGRLLMDKAERWARANGCTAVYLRSNVRRESAREFYRSIGYRKVKTQSALRKTL